MRLRNSLAVMAFMLKSAVTGNAPSAATHEESQVMLVKGTYLILGNWKMHLCTKRAGQLAESIAAISLTDETATVGVAPAFVHLASVQHALQASPVLLGAQACRAEPEGAYTGDVSATMLHDAGCRFVIAGHSERRQHYAESNAQVREQAEAILQQRMHAVICVGESLEQREKGEHLNVIESQLRESLPASFDRARLTVSYEPIWAIGTGKTAGAEDIVEMHGHIQSILHKLCSDDAQTAIPRVLYGGSVKANNALDILSLPVVDGVLVGGASLDAHAFKAIIEAAEISARKR
jgi:triosephosphate isomerase